MRGARRSEEAGGGSRAAANGMQAAARRTRALVIVPALRGGSVGSIFGAEVGRESSDARMIWQQGRSVPAVVRAIRHVAAVQGLQQR